MASTSILSAGPGVIWMLPAMFDSISVVPLVTGNARVNGSVASTHPSGIAASRVRAASDADREADRRAPAYRKLPRRHTVRVCHGVGYTFLQVLLVELAFQPLHLSFEMHLLHDKVVLELEVNIGCDGCNGERVRRVSLMNPVLRELSAEPVAFQVQRARGPVAP